MAGPTLSSLRRAPPEDGSGAPARGSRSEGDHGEGTREIRAQYLMARASEIVDPPLAHR